MGEANEKIPFKLSAIHSLEDVARKEDRVVVLNAMGGESRHVTPTSHAYSSGNVVFGVSPGKRGRVLKTPKGDIPIYNNVLEGLNDGHKFNTGVVYLPPSGVRDGVAELIRINPELEKIIIITEKIAVHDAREIQAMAQANKVTVIGGNCLGVADSWNNVRIGGALGGGRPEESLRKGSIAVFSNSGGFTSTIAQYLAMEGWGTTTLISSGKDVYIHYDAKDFAYAFKNDVRSKAAVLYVEPGGYYEQDLRFDKPVVACIVGRWKSKLTRAVGHAGAMAGSGDRAEDKENWFIEAFETDGIYTPETPYVSKKGALVTNIAHIPEVLSKVMKLNGFSADFEKTGNLDLKPWMANDQGLNLPPSIALPVVEARAPYNQQLVEWNKQIGAIVARQNMKDLSGASTMDAKTLVTSVHGQSVLTMSQEPLEAIFALPLVHEVADENARAMLDIAVAAEVNLTGSVTLRAAEAAREAGNSPNVVMAAAVALIGPNTVCKTMDCCKTLIDLFAKTTLKDGQDTGFDYSGIQLNSDELKKFEKVAKGENERRSNAMINAVKLRGGSSVFLEFLQAQGIKLSQDAVLAAIALTIAWGPLVRKKITRLTAETLPWYLKLYGVMIGASIPSQHHKPGELFGIKMEDRYANWTMDDLCYLAVTGKKPTRDDALPLQMLTGLLISNGPGAISAQGAKGAVSADGPQTPGRVQINKAMIGFLSHSGYSHGGNGFEGMELLLRTFRNQNLSNPSNPEHGINLKKIAHVLAKDFKKAKVTAKNLGKEVPALPGIHHPVFKGNAVNHDPRERFIKKFLTDRGGYNIFIEFYHEFVNALKDIRATPYVFCVNVDAVIAALLLGMLWDDYTSGRMSEHELETAAFNVFLYGRMIGAAAEIDDHLNRGRNMDTRTPAPDCGYIV